MLEDFFLRRPINTTAVLACLTQLMALDGMLMRLEPLPGPDAAVPGETLFGQISPSAPWRVSAQAAIWKRDHLMSILDEEESIWQFEVNGTTRCRSCPFGYYATYDSIMPYDHHVIERGKWFRTEARRYRSEDIGCDFSARQVMTRAEMLRWRFHKTSSRCFSWLSLPVQRFIISAVRTARSLGSSPLKRRSESGHR
jgi:hypothetical protein